LHSKQSAEHSSNGNDLDTEQLEHRQDLNPFAADEDDDEDEQEDFTLGDLEVEAEGKGLMKPGTVLVGQQATLDELELELEEVAGGNVDLHVGIPESNSEANLNMNSMSENRASFPSLWPFGQQGHSSGSHNSMAIGTYRVQERHRLAMKQNGDDRNHGRGARINADSDDTQSSDGSASDDSEDEFNSRAGIAIGPGTSGASAYESGKGKDGKSGKRRLSSTTEAKRRTSLEDDDDEEGEVVHVGRADDEELVEIQHTEMQGVESGETYLK